MYGGKAITRNCFADHTTPRSATPFAFFTLYGYRDYALFWCTDMLGSIGHFVQEVALFWITYEITGSAMALGVLGLCSALPRLILGALSGVLVDRYDRKLLLILVNFASAIPMAIFLAIYNFGTLAFWHLLVLEILFGSIRAINPSAAQSILGELVPREDVMNAVSLYTVGFNIARIAGPSLGGVLILWIGIGGCYAVFAVTLILAGVGMLFVRTEQGTIDKARRKLPARVQRRLSLRLACAGDFEQHRRRLHVCRVYRHLPELSPGLRQGSTASRSQRDWAY